MAYYIINEDGTESGPYPCDVGEYCGNHSPDSQPPLMIGQTTREAYEQQRAWLQNKRLGQPRATEYVTSHQLSSMGYRGVYLAQDAPVVGANVRYVPTPPELTEPEE